MDSKLWDALDELREKGWFQGSSVCQGARSGHKMVDRGEMCLYIALERAHGGLASTRCSDEYQRDMEILRQVCLEYFPERADSFSTKETTIIQINNHLDTTYEEVETLLEKAAIRSDEILS